MIGTALAHKAKGLGFRRIAARMGRPQSTVRRWLRRTTGEHVQWLHRRVPSGWFSSPARRSAPVRRQSARGRAVRSVDGRVRGSSPLRVSRSAVGPDRDLHTGTSAVPTPQRLTEPSRPVLPCPGASVIVPTVGVRNDAQQSPCRRARQPADERQHLRLQFRDAIVCILSAGQHAHTGASA
ncbi:helix-turn-helix domain-containing protein (plasmid) [Rhodococcus opacus]|uniref:helix-turn-helix domain-containing protein n=1 Tax=Rhodococcus opacus TaxID=37919 RepID=UPI0034D368C5